MNHDIVSMVTLPTWAPFVSVLAMAFLAFMARHRGCDCPQCTVHEEERRKRKERDRAMWHKANHAWWRSAIPWGSDKCPDCRQGHEDDEHLR